MKPSVDYGRKSKHLTIDRFMVVVFGGGEEPQREMKSKSACGGGVDVLQVNL